MMDITMCLTLDAEAQEHLADVLGRVLERTLQLNDMMVNDSQGYGCAYPLFHSKSKCPLSPSAYVLRILKFSAASPCNLVVALIFMQRLQDLKGNEASDKNLLLTSYNIQRLLLTATLLACKLYDDCYASNKQFAAIGDITTSEMNVLELEMLFALNFSLAVSREEYDHFRNAILDADQDFVQDRVAELEAEVHRLQNVDNEIALLKRLLIEKEVETANIIRQYSEPLKDLQKRFEQVGQAPSQCVANHTKKEVKEDFEAASSLERSSLSRQASSSLSWSACSDEHDSDTDTSSVSSKSSFSRNSSMTAVIAIMGDTDAVGDPVRSLEDFKSLRVNVAGPARHQILPHCRGIGCVQLEEWRRRERQFLS